MKIDVLNGDVIYETAVDATVDVDDAVDNAADGAVDGAVDDFYDEVAVAVDVYDEVAVDVYDEVAVAVAVNDEVAVAEDNFGEENDRRPALFTREKRKEEVAEEFQRLEAFDPNQTRYAVKPTTVLTAMLRHQRIQNLSMYPP